MLKVKEIFYSIQGEGYNCGKPMVFVRFVGCNLWSGRSEHKAASPCWFCDTNFLGGEKLDYLQLLERVEKLWPAGRAEKCVLFTGGEPGLQLNAELCSLFREQGFSVCVETNSTLRLPIGEAWVTASPKVSGFEVLSNVSEVKLLFGNGLNPEDVLTVYKSVCDRFYLQPIWGVNEKECVEYVKNNSPWTLSIQTHKFLDIE